MSKLSKNSKRILGGAAACLMMAGWSLSGHAQSDAVCTIDRWQVDGTPASVGLTNTDVGRANQRDSLERPFRRFAGPCGLRVPLDGQERYVRDGTPNGESDYKARFYVYLNSVSEDVLLFEAVDQANTALVEIWYDSTQAAFAADILTDSGMVNLGTTAVQPGAWNVISFQWGSVVDANGTNVAGANVELAVNGGTPTRDNLALTAGQIHEARLGSIGTATGGYVDFDDFDSRRSSAPTLVLRGDADGDNAVTQNDLFDIEAERRGFRLAGGQPDCDRSGSVTQNDVFCAEAIRRGFENP